MKAAVRGLAVLGCLAALQAAPLAVTPSASALFAAESKAGGAKSGAADAKPEGERILHYKEKNVTLSLLPETPLAATIQNAWYATHDKEPVFQAEARYRIAKRADIPQAGDNGTGDTDRSGSQIERIAAIGRAFSTMEGLEYYSNTRKKNAVLYSECYTVDGPKSKSRVPDVTTGNADGQTLYYLQKDNSFGRAVYRADYTQTGNELSFTSVNQNALHFTVFKAVNPENLLLTLLISEEEDTLSVYILAQANFLAFPMLDDFVEKSFMARLDAVYNWFKESYYEN